MLKVAYIPPCALVIYLSFFLYQIVVVAPTDLKLHAIARLVNTLHTRNSFALNPSVP